MRRASFGLRPQNLAVFALRIFRQDGHRTLSLVAAAAECGDFDGRSDSIRLRVALRSSVADAFAVTSLALHPGLRVRVSQEILYGFAMADCAQFVLLGRGHSDRRQEHNPQRREAAIRDTMHPLIA
jgi:hypothetical protein